VPARQVAGGPPHGLLGHREAEVPSAADGQDSDVAPVRDQVAEVRRRPRYGDIARAAAATASTMNW
jgi:hypothetical protein